MYLDRNVFFAMQLWCKKLQLMHYTLIAVIYSSSVLRCLWEGMREAGDEWPNCSVKGKKMS